MCMLRLLFTAVAITNISLVLVPSLCLSRMILRRFTIMLTCACEKIITLSRTIIIILVILSIIHNISRYFMNIPMNM